MIHDSGLLGNFDSMANFDLNHSFKKPGTGDFFDSLGYTETICRPGLEVGNKPLDGSSRQF